MPKLEGCKQRRPGRRIIMVLIEAAEAVIRAGLRPEDVRS